MSWVEIRRHTGRKAEYNSQQSKSDRDGRRVCACLKVNYDEEDFPWVEVWHEDLQGRQQDLQVHTLPAQPDNLTMMIAGPNVHLRVSLHGDTVDNRRPAWVLEMVLLNWYTPWPEQGMAGEPEGAVTFIPQGGQNVEIDYDRIQGMIDGAVQEVIAQFGGSGVRDGLEQKIMDGLGKAFDPALYPTNPRSRYVQDAAAPFFRDRAYEGAQAAEGTP